MTTWDAGAEISADELRRRVLWARRQGRPAWLWPDVLIADWRRALKAIEQAAGAVLAGRSAARLCGEPAAVGLAGYTSGMGPLLGLWIEQGSLSADGFVAALMERHLEHNRLRARRMTAVST